MKSIIFFIVFSFSGVLIAQETSPKQIVDDFFSYLGIKSTISVQVYVDGQDVKSSYLPYEKVQGVFELANKNYNISVIKTKTAEYKF